MNLNEWLDNPDRKGIPLPVADAIRTALAEVEQLKDVLAWQEQRNAMNVKTLTAEVEWLRTLQKKESDIYRRNVEEIEQMRAKIDKALKTAPKDPDRAALCNLPGYIRAMVRALKGGEK